MAKKFPVTKDGVQSLEKLKRRGVVSPGVSTGAVDNAKVKLASQMEKGNICAGVPRNPGSAGATRTAGMMMDFSSMPSSSNSSPYGGEMTSYATGNADYGSGSRDIPTYFILMNQQNGGILYWPVSLKEKYEWYRYFCYFLSDNDLGLISMADGTLKSIKDVQIGDEIITGKGTIKKVAEMIERVCEDPKAVKIKAWCLQNHSKTTHEHPYYILRKDNVMKDDTHYYDKIKFVPEWINADRVNIGDYVLMAPVKSDINNIMTCDETRLLGYYAAEGSLIWGKRCITTNKDGNGYEWGQEKTKVPVGISFTIHEDEEKTLGDDILKLGKEVFGKDGIICHRRRNSIEIRIAGREIGEFCQKHVGTGSATKTLSQELIMSSNDAREQFIVGYMNGDGHQYDSSTTNHGKIVIGTASANLASQVQLMAISCGIMCRIAKYKRSENCKTGYNSNTDQWHITIPSWSANKIVSSSVRFDNVDCKEDKHCAFFVNGYAAFKVKEIEYSHEKDKVYNLEIDAKGDEKSFICNGMITHNCRTDAYVGRSIDLLSDLPLSKITLHMPKLKDKEKQKEILSFYNNMTEELNLFEKLQNILFENNVIGNCFAFHEWCDIKKKWTKIVILPPEEVNAFTYPFSENARIEYMPEKLISIIKQATENPNSYGDDEFLNEMIKNIPDDVIEMVTEKGCIIMDSEPIVDDTIGSFTYQFSRRRSPYLDLGASVLERVLVPMLMKENFRYTQLALATRNMTPKNKISAPGLSPEELDDLRSQVDLSYMDPDYSIITNYDWDWEQIGAEGRLLDLQGEYEMIENQVFAGLGVTRELLTGEGTYSGNKITVEILNTVFMLTREMLVNYIEKKLFLPVAEAHGWYNTDKNGIKEYFYPKVGFNRLTIRDNQEVFENLFQLYQKGSLPIDIILELFNLDSDHIAERVKKDMFTVKDPTFNRAVENVNDEVGRALVEQTDIVDKVADYMGLEINQPSEGEGEDAFGGDDDFGGDFGGDESFSMEDNMDESGSEIENVTDALVSELPEGSTEEDVRSVLDNIEGTKSDSDVSTITDALMDELPEDASEDDIRSVLEDF